MADKLICGICEGDMAAPESKWGDDDKLDDAHLECTLKAANCICDECGFYGMSDDDTCGICGEPTRPINYADKDKFRFEHKQRRDRVCGRQ